MADCAGFIGLTERELTDRLGPADSRRVTAGDLWLMFGSPDLTLRARCQRDDPGPHRVASWTASFREGFGLLSEAARAVGLWPAAGPDAAAADTAIPLVRRPLPCPETGQVFSFTASVRAGRFTQVSVFDEAPDWL